MDKKYKKPQKTGLDTSDPKKYRREYSRLWRARHPEKKEEERIRSAKNYRKRKSRDPEGVKAATRRATKRWRERNPDAHKTPEARAAANLRARRYRERKKLEAERNVIP